jgi:hypothetical protein
VRREDVYGSSLSDDEQGLHEDDGDGAAEDDAAIRAALEKRLSGMLALDLQALDNNTGTNEADDRPEREDAEQVSFEFRLFSTTDLSSKVVLDVDESNLTKDNEGGFLTSRPVDFYLKGAPTAEELEEFRVAAIEGVNVLRVAQQRAWGLEVPWRVLRISGKSRVKSEQMSSIQSSHDDKEPRKRSRPGKQKRIALRVKEKALAEKKEALEKQRISKEEHVREKKKRLNREKKLKRRQKEKDRKRAAATEAAAEDVASSEEEEEDDDADSS